MGKVAAKSIFGDVCMVVGLWACGLVAGLHATFQNEYPKVQKRHLWVS